MQLNPVKWLVLGLLRLYRFAISPMFGQSCRYYPSCSTYAMQAVQTHGVIKGLGLASWRLLRCNPWTRGGVDFVPAAKHFHQHGEPEWVAPDESPLSKQASGVAARGE
jgi:uncharacterized protein